MAKKVLLCGCFSFGSDDHGGQPVKSRETYWALQKMYGTENVDYVETKNWKKNPFKLFFSFVRGALSHEYIIMLPALNGLKIFSRLLYVSKKY